MSSAFSLRVKQSSVLPGFGVTLGYTLLYLGLLVLLPLGALVVKASGIGIAGIAATATEPRVAAALKTSFSISFLAAGVASLFGLLIAWVLTRYDFPGRKLIDAIVDLPFALPTAVAGIALAALYAPNGWVGSLLEPLGLKVAYTPLGIFIALVFIGLPFAVRTVQPLITEIEHELEEASATLGASRWHTLWRVLLPPLASWRADGLRTGLRPRGRRIRIGHLHCRKLALCLRDRAAAHRDQAVGIRLYRRDRDRDHHAGDLVLSAFADQPASGLEPQEVRSCLISAPLSSHRFHRGRAS